MNLNRATAVVCVEDLGRNSQEPKQEPRKTWFSRPFPHDDADDRRLDLRDFFLLAYRARQTDAFNPRQDHLAARHGLGEAGYYESVEVLKGAEYLDRKQPRKKGGKFTFAQEKLYLDASTPTTDIRTGKYQILTPDIEGLKWREVGLLDYINSFPPNYLLTAKSIAKRFGLSSATIRRNLAGLVARGRVCEIRKRNHRGQMMLSGYGSGVESQLLQMPGTAKTGNILITYLILTLSLTYQILASLR